MPLRAYRARLEESFLGRCATSFVDLQGLDRAMVIASQSFTALIPLLILVSAGVPTGSGNEVADAITAALITAPEAGARPAPAPIAGEVQTIAFGSRTVVA